jgi:phosphoglycolate phosphatase
LFDLDGTLLDSAPDLVDAYNRVRQSEGLESASIEEVGRGATRGIRGILELGMPEADQATREDWFQKTLAHYRRNSTHRSSLYEGVSELIEQLVAAGLRWGIVTNKSEILTIPILDAFGLSETIACCVCGDTLDKSKPHPAPVRLACEQLGLRPEEVLFVGDDNRDIQAGRAAGTATAAVYYGYGSGELEASIVGDSYPVNHPADLLKLLQ